MQFLSVNYSLNKTYNVEEQVFVQVTKKAIKSCGNSKLIDVNVKITSEKKLFINITVEPKNPNKLEQLFTTISKKIEENVQALIERKPENIKISLGIK
ncbi:MAG: hypothetical protein KAG04_00745 [Mycoplasmataceae bacterium]|nr:hypothetical protein [Mycoplasmataceae bacterium]